MAYRPNANSREPTSQFNAKPSHSGVSSLSTHVERARILRRTRGRGAHGARSRGYVHQSRQSHSVDVSSSGKFARRKRACRSGDDACLCVRLATGICGGGRMEVFEARRAGRCAAQRREPWVEMSGTWSPEGAALHQAWPKTIRIRFDLFSDQRGKNVALSGLELFRSFFSGLTPLGSLLAALRASPAVECMTEPRGRGSELFRFSRDSSLRSE